MVTVRDAGVPIQEPLLSLHIVIGASQFKVEGVVTLEQLAPYLSHWFDALALTKRVDILADIVREIESNSGPAGGTTLRLTLAEDTPPSR